MLSVLYGFYLKWMDLAAVKLEDDTYESGGPQFELGSVATGEVMLERRNRANQVCVVNLSLGKSQRALCVRKRADSGFDINWRLELRQQVGQGQSELGNAPARSSTSIHHHSELCVVETPGWEAGSLSIH